MTFKNLGDIFFVGIIIFVIIFTIIEKVFEKHYESYDTIYEYNITIKELPTKGYAK